MIDLTSSSFSRASRDEALSLGDSEEPVVESQSSLRFFFDGLTTVESGFDDLMNSSFFNKSNSTLRRSSLLDSPGNLGIRKLQTELDEVAKLKMEPVSEGYSSRRNFNDAQNQGKQNNDRIDLDAAQEQEILLDNINEFSSDSSDTSDGEENRIEQDNSIQSAMSSTDPNMDVESLVQDLQGIALSQSSYETTSRTSYRHRPNLMKIFIQRKFRNPISIFIQNELLEKGVDPLYIYAIGALSVCIFLLLVWNLAMIIILSSR